MRTGLAGFAIAVPDQKMDEFASANHSVQRQRDSFGVDRASGWNGLALFAAVLNVEPHSFEDALLGFFDGLAETVHAREVLAICIIALSLAFDGDRITV